jgi:hypothetical protein
MESIERDGRRLLAPLRDDAPGPSTVDLERAVRTGARRVRARQVVVAAAAAVLTGLAGVAVPAVIGHHRAVEPARPAEFSVLRQQFAVGSAGGFTPVSYETGRTRQRVELGPASGEGPDRATVTMYPRGARRQPAAEPAPDVNGHKAFWTTANEIAWEWSAGAWGFASINTARSDARDRVHRVAESVSPGADTPVRVPFTIPNPPSTLLGVITPFGTSSDPAEGALVVLGTPDNRVLVGVQRDLTRDLVTGATRPKPEVTIPDVGGGYSVLAQADQPGAPLAELAAGVRLVPNPGDVDSWVLDPIR